VFSISGTCCISSKPVIAASGKEYKMTVFVVFSTLVLAALYTPR
jgi:hypothetical protein